MTRLGDLADDAGVKVAWDEACANALDLVRAWGPPGDDWTL